MTKAELRALAACATIPITRVPTGAVALHRTRADWADAIRGNAPRALGAARRPIVDDGSNSAQPRRSAEGTDMERRHEREREAAAEARYYRS